MWKGSRRSSKTYAARSVKRIESVLGDETKKKAGVNTWECGV